MSYIDGFMVAVQKAPLEKYKAFAEEGTAIWKEFGAIGFVESIENDVPKGELTSFPRAVQAKDDEVVILSWIIYESREHRDSVSAKVMADPRIQKSMANPPFDGKRMIYGGFKTFLE
jgi:uncharacterized protein YbaA (DUF1428 family)